MNLIWYDGKLVRAERVQIGVLSHTLHYGTGVFEGVRAYATEKDTAVFRLNEHVARLFRSASVFGRKIPFTERRIAEAIRAVVTANSLKECYIRPIIFFGEGNMGLSLDKNNLHVAIAAWPWGAYLGEHAALSVGISQYVRFHPQSVIPGAKITGFYATSTLATIEARKRGFDECILLDHKGYISEGPGENIFMVKRGILYTPKEGSILPGITRDSIIKIARSMNIRTVEKLLTVRDLLAADEIFLTGTAAEVASVNKVNRHKIGKTGMSNPITDRLRQEYMKAVRGKIPRYRHWLTL